MKGILNQHPKTWPNLRKLGKSTLSLLFPHVPSHETTQSRRKLTKKRTREKIFDHFSISDELRRSSGSSRGLPYLASNYLVEIRGHAKVSGIPARERINIRHRGFHAGQAKVYLPGRTRNEDSPKFRTLAWLLAPYEHKAPTTLTKALQKVMYCTTQHDFPGRHNSLQCLLQQSLNLIHYQC